MTNCACPDSDELTCFDIRHFGYSPAQTGGYGTEVCECSCHESDYDEDNAYA